MRIILIFVTLLIIHFVYADKVTYHDYKVIRTQSLNSSMFKTFQGLSLDDAYDFWKYPSINGSADIMVSPQSFLDLEQILDQSGIQFTIMIDNVEAMEEEEESEAFVGPLGVYCWSKYYGHPAINAFIDSLANLNPYWVKTVSIGKSLEGRDMRVLVIDKAGPRAPIVWIDAGIHAREWISSATATFMINELVNNYIGNKDIVDNLNIHILPMSNPDGYEYSRSTDRLWRKNRRLDFRSNCQGVDLNRNWGFHWGGIGASGNPCSSTYHGSSAFSEPETRNIKNYLEDLRVKPVLGYSIHSYSQLLLWPYGFGINKYPGNWQDIKRLAEDATGAIYNVHRKHYRPINAADLCKFF